MTKAQLTETILTAKKRRKTTWSAIAKAESAYGAAIRNDLAEAIAALQNRHGWLERCMQVMAMEMPKALLWQQVRKLRRAL